MGCVENLGCDVGVVRGSAAEWVRVCLCVGGYNENEDAEFFGLSVIALRLAPTDFCKAVLSLMLLLPVSPVSFLMCCVVLPYCLTS